jgi:chromosome partitioning protein
VGATLGEEPADGSVADGIPAPRVSERGGPSGPADEHSVDPVGEEDAATAIDPSSQALDHAAVVDSTTGGPEPDRDVVGGPSGEAAAAARPTAGAPAGRGDANGTEQANIATSAPASDVGEVDLREASPSPSGDVSRETSAGGGEEMESREEEHAVVEDEAAVAVREAATRAAAEAGVDVSRETEVPEEELLTGGLVGEPSMDSEAAARNARVTFRIHRETLNGTRRVTAVANQKGGVGKSTTAVNIGAYLALAGARVLVVDLDPQGNASTGLGLDREIEPSIYDVLTGEAPTAAAIRATSVANLYVLPSTIDLAGAEVELVSAMSRETRLRRALEAIDHQYDTVLIDCPPSLGLLTVNALAAANELLIPIQCEYYALEGLGQLLRNVELVRANLNPELRIGGIVLTMYDGRTRLALQVVEEVRKHFTDIVFQTVVPRSVRLSEAPGYGVPIALYDPLSRGGIAYRDLTFELAERTGLLAPTGEGAS